MQTTIKSPVSFRGTGLHSGRSASLTIRPAAANQGIWFERTDIGGPAALIRAHFDSVRPSQLCTVLHNAHGTSISTVEHVMAALAGSGIHNARIEVNGPEAPILDGSAMPYVEGILEQGVRRLGEPVQAIRILREVRVEEGNSWAMLSPSDGFEIEFEISFEDQAIGTQRKRLNMANGAFVRELCNSRTFCRKADVDTMRANGLALGGSLENAIVVDGPHVLNPEGLRHADEAVRHKMLDALGDLALAGAPILGRYTGHRAGHRLTNRLLRKLFHEGLAHRVVSCDAATAARLPGVGVGRGDVPGVA